MAGFNIIRGEDGLPVLVIGLDGEEPIFVQLEAAAARDVVRKLAVILADLGDADAPYTVGVPEGEVVEPPALAPVSLPDVVIEQNTGTVGMIFAHPWLGPLGLMIGRKDALTLGKGLSALDKPETGRKRRRGK